MSIKNRLKKLEEAHGGAAQYVVDSWDDYHRVRSKLGWGWNVFVEMNKPEEERQPDPYDVLLSQGRLVETPRFKQMDSRNQVNAFIELQLGSGELPEF